MKFRHVLTVAMLASGLLAAAHPATASPGKATATPAHSGVVLVVGATGRSGPAMLAALKQEGYTNIRALVRDVEKAKAQLGDGIELVQADVRDAASLDRAMVGVTYIISALGSNTFNDPTNSPEFVDYEGVRNLAQAAKKAGVAQFVQVSSLGVSRAKEHPLNRFGRVMEWKAKGEEALRASGVPYTLVRAGGLQDTPGGEAGIQVTQGDTVVTGQITRADVAMVCVKALHDPASRDKTFEIIAGEKGATVDWASFFSRLQPDA
ncbi:MAG TPA: SDR family oxidoreductase [Steroidobacteraceae bacterium]|nr:SDR family oxidoreductase [Steroidobacteraceae bacterium]